MVLTHFNTTLSSRVVVIVSDAAQIPLARQHPHHPFGSSNHHHNLDRCHLHHHHNIRSRCSTVFAHWWHQGRRGLNDISKNTTGTPDTAAESPCQNEEETRTERSDPKQQQQQGDISSPCTSQQLSIPELHTSRESHYWLEDDTYAAATDDTSRKYDSEVGDQSDFEWLFMWVDEEWDV